MSNGTGTDPLATMPTSSFPIGLVPQTGMAPVYHPRSKELIYDCLEQNVRFVKNPFGPQLLVLSRPNHHW
jgi:hypothetical protein